MNSKTSYIAVMLGALAAYVASASGCGDGGNARPGSGSTSTAGSGGGETSSTTDSSSSSSTGTGGTGGAGGAGGTGGDGGTGGSGESHGPPVTQTVNGGNVSTSSKHKMVSTFGQPTQTQQRSTSQGHQMHGGLIGANGSLP